MARGTSEVDTATVVKQLPESGKEKWCYSSDAKSRLSPCCSSSSSSSSLSHHASLLIVRCLSLQCAILRLPILRFFPFLSSSSMPRVLTYSLPRTHPFPAPRPHLLPTCIHHSISSPHAILPFPTAPPHPLPPSKPIFTASETPGLTNR